jgi:hypothetical protein
MALGLSLLLLVLSAEPAEAQQRGEVNLTHEHEGTTLRYRVRATAEGVVVRSGDTIPQACRRRGRAVDLHPRPGNEQLYECPDSFGILALGATDGTLVWAGFTGDGSSTADFSWPEAAVADLTGDGRAEAILSGEVDRGAEFGWELKVLTFEESGPRVLHSENAGAYDGETTHAVEVRGTSLVHVETRGTSRTEQVLAYDAAARALRRRAR